MIRLTCTSCQAVLEMDDAFAGGVCRCQHCGTIQTVPSHLKDAPTSGVYPKPTAAKSLYSGGRPGTGSRTSPTGQSSGLDDLAGAVASSGLSSGNLNLGRPAPSQRTGNGTGRGGPTPATIGYQTPSPGKNKTILIAVLVGGAILLAVIGVLVFLLLGSSTPVPVVTSPAGGTGSTGGTTGGTVPAPPPVVKTSSGPNFGGLPLSSGKVVYVLDRGDASRSLFDPLKAVVYKSVTSLGPNREFQVVFWQRSGDANLDEGAYPVGKTAKATPEEEQAMEKKFEDLTASGATDIEAAIKSAVARNPGEIVIATAKGAYLDDGVRTMVESARGNSNIKIHTISLGAGGSSNVLKAIAVKTGGSYIEISESELRN